MRDINTLSNVEKHGVPGRGLLAALCPRVQELPRALPDFTFSLLFPALPSLPWCSFTDIFTHAKTVSSAQRHYQARRRVQQLCVHGRTAHNVVVHRRRMEALITMCNWNVLRWGKRYERDDTNGYIDTPLNQNEGFPGYHRRLVIRSGQAFLSTRRDKHCRLLWGLHSVGVLHAEKEQDSLHFGDSISVGWGLVPRTLSVNMHRIVCLGRHELGWRNRLAFIWGSGLVKGFAHVLHF